MATPTATTASASLSPARAQQLDDWRIRAGLYAANEKPPALAYVSDASLGSWSAGCRDQEAKLGPFRPGPLKAPDATLARLARTYDQAARQLLTACEHNQPVELHHAEGQITATASEINVRYARLLGQDPSSPFAKHVL